MPCEVRMPQLGMNQDSAVIVTWLKTAGDAVAEGEALFEVETDKATVEVEAQSGGWLAEVRTGEGTDVPVGDVIAVIAESEAELAGYASDVPAAPPPPAERPDPVTDPAPPPAAASDRAGEVAPPPDGARKVLASPKARRLAAQRGIDLAALRGQGVPEPIHAADLASAAPGGASSLGARVDGAGLDALLAKGATAADRSMLLAAFAAGAWRARFGTETVGVTIRGLDGTTAQLANPDRGGEGEAAPALVLIDLCDTRLCGYAPAGGTALSVARDGAGYALTLTFSEAALAMPDAVAVLDDIAARVEDPIRQLL